MSKEKVIVIKAETDKANKNIEKLDKSVKDIDKSTKETNKSLGGITGTLDKVTGGAISKFNAFKGSVGGVTSGFKSLRVAIIGTGIGALVIAVVSLIQAFKRSEDGQNKFAKLMGIIGSVVDNVLDLFADLGENIISVFENPKQALIDFKNLIVENIENRIKATIDTFGFLGSAIKKVFSGDFEGAIDDAKKAGSSFVDSMTGVENTIGKATEAVKEFSKEVVADANKAAKIADQRAEAERLARNLIVERAEAERKIAELREKAADKENFNAKERIDFLKQAGAISEDLANKETKVAEIRLKAQQAENSLAKSNKEALDEEARLKADLINKETQRLKLQKALTAEITTATREANSEAAAAAKAKQDRIDAENKLELEKEAKRLQDIAAIQEEYKKKQEDKEAETELQKIELEEARKLKELNDLNATEEQKLQIENYYRDLKAEAQDKADQEELARKKALEQQKIALVQTSLGNLSNALDKSSKAGKAVAVAQALINTYQGITTELATKTATPFEFGLKLANIASVAAIGFKSVKDIVSTKTPNVGSITGTGGGGASGGGAPATPQFNIVGQDSQSQIGQAIGQQEQQPVQAYVVANDVTTAQSLNNNIVDGASLG